MAREKLLRWRVRGVNNLAARPSLSETVPRRFPVCELLLSPSRAKSTTSCPTPFSLEESEHELQPNLDVRREEVVLGLATMGVASSGEESTGKVQVSSSQRATSALQGGKEQGEGLYAYEGPKQYSG